MAQMTEQEMEDFLEQVSNVAFLTELVRRLNLTGEERDELLVRLAALECVTA